MNSPERPSVRVNAPTLSASDCADTNSIVMERRRTMTTASPNARITLTSVAPQSPRPRLQSRRPRARPPHRSQATRAPARSASSPASFSITARPTHCSATMRCERAERPPESNRVREEQLRAERQHHPVPRGGRPLKVGEVTPGVLKQRPLVDHRQLQVGVRVIDRLATGLDQHHEQERDRAAPVRRPRSTRERLMPPRPSPAAPCSAPGAPRPGAPARAAPRRTQRASHRARRPSTRTRCPYPQAAAAPAKRESASTPTSTSASSPTPKSPARPATGTSSSATTAQRRRPAAARPGRPRLFLRARPSSCATACAASGRAAKGDGPRRPCNRALTVWTLPGSSGATR